jgi:predicted ATPase/DNA-binding CsgD family transcriptional regulator
MSLEPTSSLLDRLVGRTREVGAIEAALAGARLVTITGLGGAGKTRLAREVLARSATRGTRGWFVDLAHLSDPATVPGAIAAALGVGDSDEIDVASAVAREIGRTPSLLVLDNLEQVIGARSHIVDLIARAGPARILATSRVRLGARGELVITLDPLPIPTSADELEASDAGRLFLARARERGTLASLTDGDRRAIVEICRLLDGLPLALELGAAWTRLLPAPAIRRRLEEGRLTLAADDDAGRHTSLRAVVESTLGLVGADELIVFEALAVFAGGFDEAAAEAVTGAVDVLTNLRRLEEVALVRVVGDRDGDARFTLLETIRTVAVAGLAARGSEEAVRHRHAAWFATWAETWVEVLRRSGDRVARAAFEAEMPNLRAAHAFAVGCDDAPLALRLATAMGVVGRRSPGSLREHIARLEHALAMGTVPPEVRCEGLNALAWLADDVSTESTDVEAVTAEALGLAEGLRSPLHIARSMITRATVAVPPDAVELLERAAAVAVEHGLSFEAASAYNNGADVLGRQGRLVEARDLCDRALAISSASGDRFGQSLALQNAGEIDANLGRPADAVVSLEAAVEGHSVASSGTHLARSLSLLASAEALSGRATAAYRHLAESAEMIEASDATTAMVNFLGDAVTVLLAGHRLPAVHALGAVRRAEPGTAMLLGQPLLDAAEQAASVTMGRARFDRAFTAGAEATARGVFEEVRALLAASGGPARRRSGTRLRGLFGELTERETEVLALLAEARTDLEIAEALDISPKTSSVHVTNIKSKLGVETRLEAALRARELLAAATSRQVDVPSDAR